MMLPLAAYENDAHHALIVCLVKEAIDLARWEQA